MLKGLVEAYRYLGCTTYLELALDNAAFMQKTLFRETGGLFRCHTKGRSHISAFLEDYATTIDAFLALYEVTFEEKWLNQAKNMLDYTRVHFWDQKSGLFFFTSAAENFLIRKTIEVFDDVIPASNAIMAHNLWKLHKFFPLHGYGSMAKQMVTTVQGYFNQNAQGVAHWLPLVLYQNQPFYEIAVVGENYKTLGRELNRHYTPNSLLAGAQKEGNLPLLKARYVEGKTTVYICREGICQQPVATTAAALECIRLQP